MNRRLSFTSVIKIIYHKQPTYAVAPLLSLVRLASDPENTCWLLRLPVCFLATALTTLATGVSPPDTTTGLLVLMRAITRGELGLGEHGLGLTRRLDWSGVLALGGRPGFCLGEGSSSFFLEKKPTPDDRNEATRASVLEGRANQVKNVCTCNQILVAHHVLFTIIYFME